MVLFRRLKFHSRIETRNCNLVFSWHSYQPVRVRPSNAHQLNFAAHNEASAIDERSWVNGECLHATSLLLSNRLIESQTQCICVVRKPVYPRIGIQHMYQVHQCAVFKQVYYALFEHFNCQMILYRADGVNMEQKR